MGERILELIRQVGIFMICAQMILHFKPAKQYGKYIKLLMSMMVLVQFVIPLLGMLGGKGENAFTGKLVSYEQILQEGMEQINTTCLESERLLNEMTMEEVKLQINNLNTEETDGTDEEGIYIGKIEVGNDD